MLVGYYRSFRLPLLAMVSIPLAGVVVRNLLLIIDFIQAYQAEGFSLDDSIREAGTVRLRPILLTTLAIIFGTAIMVPDAVMGGDQSYYWCSQFSPVYRIRDPAFVSQAGSITCCF